MSGEKKLKIQNLAILSPSLVKDIDCFTLKKSNKTREIIHLEQDNSLITIGTYNMNGSFDTLDNKKIEVFTEDNICFNNPYVGVFKGDNVNMLNYLWNLRISSAIELCKYQVSPKRDYTKEELKYILELIKEEQKYKNPKTKKYIFTEN